MNAQQPTEDAGSFIDSTPLAEKSPRHVIVFPGGGYAGYAENEAEPIAEWLRQFGLSASVFRYPVRERHPTPVDAVQSEVRRIRASGIERVALMGFSAGGHVAGHAALAAGASGSERVDAVILGYPVVSMELDTDPGSRRELLGPTPRTEDRLATSLDRLVTEAAPPFFIWHTADDSSVTVEHAYLLAQALARHGVSHALHVFSTGRHGLGLAQGRGEPEAWPALCAAWLSSRGWLDGLHAPDAAGA
ncbi:alpha/beta hydrolase [Citricoccus sp.]|uniref:alpha/beta hydrolase n=1 Tax=Citricoccus sp. TaxID=1978372 RepID=UPI0028BF2812|nr:alpha/beta hydrolase [Citricoccus sp.]